MVSVLRDVNYKLVVVCLIVYIRQGRLYLENNNNNKREANSE